jgi:hypothetical protein
MALVNKDKSPSLSQQDESSDGEEGMKYMMGKKLLIVVTLKLTLLEFKNQPSLQIRTWLQLLEV